VGKRILMVEDDGDARAIFRTILEHVGYQVLELTGGATTTAVVRRERPDLVLLDIGLPDVDGWTVATRLRDDPEVSSVRILVVTAEERPDAAQLAQGLSVDLLAKPISPTRLAAEVRQRVGAP
jgi:DNA-binding response OmpR family regulator